MNGRQFAILKQTLEIRGSFSSIYRKIWSGLFFVVFISKYACQPQNKNGNHVCGFIQQKQRMSAWTCRENGKIQNTHTGWRDNEAAGALKSEKRPAGLQTASRLVPLYSCWFKICFPNQTNQYFYSNMKKKPKNHPEVAKGNILNGEKDGYKINVARRWQQRSLWKMARNREHW